MIKISQTAKRLMLLIIVVALLAFVIGVIVLRDTSGIIIYGNGLLLGTLFTLLKVILLEKIIDKSLDMSSAKAPLYSTVHFLLRYILTGAVLVIAAKNPLSLWGAAIGLIAMQVAAYMSNFLDKYKIPKKL